MRDLAVGFGYLVNGQRWVARHGKWWGFGIVPALITFVGYAAALVALFFWTDDVVAWATPFAGNWPSPWPGVFRGALAILFAAAGLFLAVITFTAVTLLVGQPFYESLSEQVDLSEGGIAPESGLPLWRELWIGLREAVALVVRVTIWSTVFFALGFVPVIGQTVIPALAICVTGFFLTEELTSIALMRRGILLRERRRMLRTRRMLTLGFGMPLALLFLLPLVAVLLMPGAVAGATLLVRDLTGDDGAEADGEFANGDPGRAAGALSGG